MQEIIKPNTVKRVQGYGLPHPKDTARKGDLLIAFDIKFPEKLTTSEKELLSDLLPNWWKLPFCFCCAFRLNSNNNSIGGRGSQNTQPHHTSYNKIYLYAATLGRTCRDREWGETHLVKNEELTGSGDLNFLELDFNGPVEWLDSVLEELNKKKRNSSGKGEFIVCVSAPNQDFL